MYMYGLGEFYYAGTGTWNSNGINQSNAFRALVEEKQLPEPSRYKLPKDFNDLSMNIHEIDVILLSFQV